MSFCHQYENILLPPPPFPLRRFCNYSPDALRPPGALCRVQKRLLFWPLSIFALFRQIQPCPFFGIHIFHLYCAIHILPFYINLQINRQFLKVAEVVKTWEKLTKSLPSAMFKDSSWLMMMILDVSEMTMMANASCSSSADVPKAKRLEADARRRWPPTVVGEVVE